MNSPAQYTVDNLLAARVLRTGRETAAMFSLPSGRSAHRGTMGPRQGKTAGSSVELFDHREYHPGDDIRHIDWRVTARGQRPVIRMFEQETAPRVEILLDTSASMRITPEKWERSLETVAFLLEAALLENATPRLMLNEVGLVRELRHLDFRMGWQGESSAHFHGGKVPWSTSGFRFVVSDLLFSGTPVGILMSWQGNGPLVVLVPRTSEEENPSWEDLDLVQDCETADQRELRHSLSARSAYRRAYQLHFEGWRDALRARGGFLLPIPTATRLPDAIARPDSPFNMR